MTRAEIFTRYNRLRRAAMRQPDPLDLGRLNRALGIALSQKSRIKDTTLYHPHHLLLRMQGLGVQRPPPPGNPLPL